MGNRYIGKRLGRYEGMEKASGRAKYAGDYNQDGMLEAVVLRSFVAHGCIEAIDISAVPSDVFVYTAGDLKENIIEDVVEDQPVLAKDRVRFLSEPIAVVAANTREEAMAAASLIKVSYRVLPVVSDVFAAMDEDAIKIHPSGNLLQSFYHEKGDVETAFSNCDLVLEKDFSTPMQDHAYMEPEAAFAYLDEHESLCLYTSTQNVFHDLKMVCRALKLSPEQVHIKAATVGGGFGGKDGHTLQIFAAMVTWLSRRPCRIVFDRTESLAATYKRHPAKMHVRMGFSKEGKILAFDGRAYLDTGAYAGLGTAVLGLFSEHFAGPYDIPNVKIESRLYYTNKPPAHAMRGFGAPQGAFATETMINLAAVYLSIDQIEIRLKNALVKGAAGALGQKMLHCVGFREALMLIRESGLWKEARENKDPYIGYGVAGGHLSCGLGKNLPDQAKVQVETKGDGYYTIKIGLVDIGQGSRTALHAMAAEALEVPMEAVKLIMADTRETFDCGSTAASRSTFIAGNAMLHAIRELKKYPKEDAQDLTGSADFPEAEDEFESFGFPHSMYTFIAQAVKLRVNPVTGKPELLDICSATEAGKIINPLSMEGQIQGGIAMSLGFAFGENCIFKDGVLLNSDFSTYLLPTAMDVPAIKSMNVEAYEDSGPMGVKGAAEVATVSIAPAIGEALRQVSNVQQYKLPYDINTILSALIKGGDL